MEKEILTYINSKPVYKNFIENLPYNPLLKSRAKNLRKAGNYPEVVFWLQVHKAKFHKLDFDRQRIIGNYIVDFYIKPLGLIIEIDAQVIMTKMFMMMFAKLTLNHSTYNFSGFHHYAFYMT